MASGFVSFSQFVLASDANPLPTEHALRVDHLTLDPPAPNPATNLTRIGFTLAAPAHARVIVYDVLGRELIRVVDEFMSAGSHATDIETAGLSGGLYIIRLQVGSASASRSLVVMR